MVKVMDFGIARQETDSPTCTQSLVGTPLYMAPEQEMGIARKESDIYALGACVYEMLTGARPFSPMNLSSKLNRDYEKPSSLVEGLPLELDYFMASALEPDPDKRIARAQDFLECFNTLHLPLPSINFTAQKADKIGLPA